MYVEANNVQAKISLIGWDWGQSILQVRLTGKNNLNTPAGAGEHAPRCAGEGADPAEDICKVFLG